MLEPSQLKQAKDVIKYLKLQAERNNLLSTSNVCMSSGAAGTDNHNQLKSYEISDSGICQSLCDNYEDELNLREDKLKEQSVTRLSNFSQIQINFNKDVEVTNLLNINDTVKNHSYNGSTVTLHNKEADEYVSYSSENVVGHLQSDYLQKQNKRFKTRHITCNKQSHLTQFYSVVKSVNDNFERATTCSEKFKNTPFSSSGISNTTNKCENYISECKDLYLGKVNDTNSSIYCSENKSKYKNSTKQTNKLYDTHHKISFDEFCSNVIASNCDKYSKGNTFLKSFSTGNINQRKENHNHTNSLPMTSCEIKTVNEDLEKNRTAFDDFIERILKKLKNKNNETTETSTEANIPNNCKNDYDSESSRVPQAKRTDGDISITNLTSDIDSKKPQTTHYIKNFVHNSSLDLAEKYNLSFRTSVAEHNQTADFHEYELLCEGNQDVEISTKKYKSGGKIVDADEINMLNNSEVDLLEKYNLPSRDSFPVHKQKADFHKYTICDSNPDTEISIQKYKRDGQIIIDTEKGNTLKQIPEERQSTMETLSQNSFDELYSCSCVDGNVTDFNKKETNSENRLESEINLLNNDLERSILSSTYKCMENIQKNERTSETTIEASNSDKFEDKLENILNIISNIERKEIRNNTSNKKHFSIKRYKKGKIKIYRLKKLRKEHLEIPEKKKDLNIHGLLKNVMNNCETRTPLLRMPSTSSISTASSYITDDTKSDNLSTGSKELTSPQQRLRSSFNQLAKDKSLFYSGKEWKDVTEDDKEDVKMKIQDIFFQTLDDFKNKKTSYFKHRRQTFENCIFKDGRLQFKPDTESSMTVISSNAKRSKAKFQLMLYIMKKIQTLLETDTKITKRELYYQLKALISNQQVTDRAINAISCLLDVGMWALNIIAQKGLVFGKMKLLLSSGEILNCNIPGTLIPHDVSAIVEIHSSAYFILVVEKESIFHKLIEEDLPNKLTRPFIMITGKGFPDLNTQLFLRKLWMIMSIPVFILVDADPHGINIMLNYRFGSVNNAHVSQHLAVPNAKWLGVYPSEVINLNIAKQPLNETEIKLVNSILRTPYVEFSPKLADELNFLLTKKYKAGIEGLIKSDSYLSEVYLPQKFFTRNFI